jgi:hypothetical protein
MPTPLHAHFVSLMIFHADTSIRRFVCYMYQTDRLLAT